MDGKPVTTEALPYGWGIVGLGNRDCRICLRGFIREVATKREHYATPIRRPADRPRTGTARSGVQRDGERRQGLEPCS